MKCDKCDKPAVVHEVTIKNGVKAEIHLCEAHAAEAGYVVHQTTVAVGELLKKFALKPGVKPGAVPGKVCLECGQTFAAFRKSGTLGCPKCYEAFAEELSPIIERAQAGATCHLGKAPRDRGVAVERQMEIRRLIRELDLAVSSEQYERAARIRDRLNTLEPPADRPDATPHPPSRSPEIRRSNGGQSP